MSRSINLVGDFLEVGLELRDIIILLGLLALCGTAESGQEILKVAQLLRSQVLQNLRKKILHLCKKDKHIIRTLAVRVKRSS